MCLGSTTLERDEMILPYKYMMSASVRPETISSQVVVGSVYF